MNPDDFEQQLQRQPLRTPPAAWREEILTAGHASILTVGPSHRSVINPMAWWHELILPARRLWAGLAAVWTVIGIVTLATHDPAPTATKSAARPPEAQQALRAQQQLRAELIGRIEPTATDQPRKDPSSPHSTRPTTLANV